MHSSPLHESWWTYLARTAPRIVSQLDRDRHSPTFGSFDRDYWHYKIRDYSSMILQQGMIVLHVLKNHPAEQNVFYQRPELGAWVAGCLEFWAKSQLNSGSFNEYYPHEHGFPPTAFSLYAVGLMLQSNEYAVDPGTRGAVQRAVDWLTSHQEKKALNQEMAALAGMALCCWSRQSSVSSWNEGGMKSSPSTPSGPGLITHSMAVSASFRSHWSLPCRHRLHWI